MWQCYHRLKEATQVLDALSSFGENYEGVCFESNKSGKRTLEL